MIIYCDMSTYDALNNALRAYYVGSTYAEGGVDVASSGSDSSDDDFPIGPIQDIKFEPIKLYRIKGGYDAGGITGGARKTGSAVKTDSSAGKATDHAKEGVATADEVISFVLDYIKGIKNNGV